MKSGELSPIQTQLAPEHWVETPYSVTWNRTRYRQHLAVAIPWHPSVDILPILAASPMPSAVSWWLSPVSTEQALAALHPIRSRRRGGELDELYAAIASDDVRLWDVSVILQTRASAPAGADMTDEAVMEALDEVLDGQDQHWRERLRPSHWALRVPSEDQARALTSAAPLGMPPLTTPIRLASHHVSTWFPARTPSSYHLGGWFLGTWQQRWVSAPPTPRVTIVGPAHSGRSSAARWLSLQLAFQEHSEGLVLDANRDAGWAVLAHVLGPTVYWDATTEPRINAWALYPGIPRQKTLAALETLCQWVATVIGGEAMPETLLPTLREALDQCYSRRGLTDDPTTWVTSDALAWQPQLKPMPTVHDFIADLGDWPDLAPLAPLLDAAFRGPLAPLSAAGNTWVAPETPEGRTTTISYGDAIRTQTSLTTLLDTWLPYLVQAWKSHRAEATNRWILLDDPVRRLPDDVTAELTYVDVIADRRRRDPSLKTLWCMPGTSTAWLAPAERQALAGLGDSFWISAMWRHPVTLTPSSALAPLIYGHMPPA